MTKKKYHLKNDKVEHVLLYHFLNDENHAQVVSPGKKKAAFALLIFVYTRKKKAWSNFFQAFLTIKKLELDFTNLFNHDKNYTELFVEA